MPPLEDILAFVDSTDKGPSGFLVGVQKLKGRIRDILVMEADMKNDERLLFGACSVHLTISIEALCRIYGRADYPASLVKIAYAMARPVLSLLR